MSDTTHDLLVRGIAAAKAGEAKEARFYLERLESFDPTVDEQLDAWYWLSRLCDDPVQKRRYIEDMLANDPGDGRARRELAILDGKLTPGQIIDPENPPEPDKNLPLLGTSQRLICPQCGGRMTYSPDGTSLVCDYCESRKTLARQSQGPIPEDDFVISLAQAKGHLAPVQLTVHVCQGCGASFLFQPDQLSGTCPYCESNYVVKESQDRSVILPNSLLPFEVDEKMTRQLLDNWLTEKFSKQDIEKVSGRGLYLPVWTFDVGGQINWTCEIWKKERWIPFSDQKVILENDVPILATKKIKYALRKIIASFDLEKLVPFETGYLSSWTAENHEISMAEASLDARKAALDIEKPKIENSIPGNFRNLFVDSSSILVDTYKLVLLPLWICHYVLAEKTYDLAINGQNGTLVAETPATGPIGWVEKFFNLT